MQELTINELKNISGGAGIALATTALIWKILAALGIGVVGVGIFDGFTNPTKCRR